MKAGLALVFILALIPVRARVDLSASVEKKINKELLALWPGRSLSRTLVEVPDDRKSSLGFELPDAHLFLLADAGKTIGYLYLADAMGRYDTFDFMVVFKPDLSVLSTRVLVYREDYGGEIGSRRWLRQFEGKTNGEDMEFGKDIQGISGATMSARSFTRSISQLSRNMHILRRAGWL